MEIRGITRLCQLQDEELFSVVSEGLTHILEVVNRLERSVLRLPVSRKFYTKSIHSHAVQILSSTIKEEAAKFLILLDFLRCPPSCSQERGRQLGYFYNHLAKLIYAKYCDWYLSNFQGVKRAIDPFREDYYLDGPLGVDWIFYNHFLSEREDKLYVNYVYYGEDEGCDWQYPRPENFTFGYHTPGVVQLARAMYEVGLCSPEALALMAEIWREIEITEDLDFQTLEEHNERTLEAMKQHGLLQKSSSSQSYYHVVRRWLFPLYPLDLNKKKISKSSLREIQDSWTPEDFGVDY